ncbi:MAG: hypothetical protein J7J25_02645 [Candidatus Omnitrophica bacterium]|nr:hypothetical protein [Candidatus Omnitrophota bacterium]
MLTLRITKLLWRQTLHLGFFLPSDEDVYLRPTAATILMTVLPLPSYKVQLLSLKMSLHLPRFFV